jgi:hypothetical protein
MVIMVAACNTPPSNNNDGPQLVDQVTIDSSVTPRPIGQGTSLPTEETLVAVDVQIPTKTPRVKNTPPFFTNTPPPTRTLTLTATLSPTATTTATVTITPTPTHTPTPSYTPSITPTFVPIVSPTPILFPTTFFVGTVAVATISCPFSWFFAPSPTGCPTLNPITTALVFQQFEHGIMIWLGTERVILVLFDAPSSLGWGGYPDGFVDGMPINDPSLVPPAEMLQPVRGFGLLWRADTVIRNQLGWAIGPEQGYTGFSQIDSGSGTRYVQGPDGIIYVLSGTQGIWWRQ